MKKVLVSVAVIVVLFFACAYLFIPSTFEFQVSKSAVVNPTAAARVLFLENNWHKWWPEANRQNEADSVFHFNSTSFTIDRELYNAFKIDILEKTDTIHSLFSLVPKSADTTQLQWNAILNTSANPFTRINKYLNANATRRKMDTILTSLVSFLQNQENVYGMHITREVVQDTLLVFKEEIASAYPSTTSIYSIVNTLKESIRKAGAHQTNSPMMNVIQLAPEKYRVMVAIPVDREFTVTDSISFRRMVRGWILVSDIKGGPARIKSATSEMRNFVNDYSKIPIALPFESMVTDRIAEQDTSKWVTRLYFPIVL